MLHSEQRDRKSTRLRSGCDIALHCNGDLEEMKAIAQRLKHQKMTNEAVMRYNRTVEWLQTNLKP